MLDVYCSKTKDLLFSTQNVSHKMVMLIKNMNFDKLKLGTRNSELGALGIKVSFLLNTFEHGVVH